MIRNMVEADVEEVYSIFTSVYNERKIDKGFLLRFLSRETFINNKDNTIVYVNDKNKILGFIIFKDMIGLNRLKFIGEEYANHKYVADICIDYKQSNKGIGSLLMTELFIRYTKCKWLSCIVLEPYINKPSFKLHSKFGFKEIAVMDDSNAIEECEKYVISILERGY